VARRTPGLRVFTSYRVESRTRFLIVSKRMLVAIAIPAVLLALWTAMLQVPPNVLEVSRSSPSARVVVSAFPQGWSFFTRSPQEEQLRVYVDSLPPRTLDRTPLSEPRNAFGLDRGVRRQNVELESILSKFHDGDWHPCGADSDCLTAAGPARTVDNPAQDPNYCGTIVVVGSNIVPWGYRELVPATFQNVRAIRLQVRCLH